jgi:nucleoid-associated protein YgaU
MGLFDFVSDIGNKIFGKDEDPSKKLTEYVEEENPGIEDLSIEVVDEVAVIKGTTDSAEAMEKAVLMAGNVKGIKEVKVDNLTSPEQTEEIEYYTIEKGDTLWKVASKFYGKGNLYTQIFEANKEVIKDPNRIFPGQKIRIPKK